MRTTESVDNVATVPWQRRQKACWYCVTSRINPQAHGYHCTFHPRVFQGIISTEECEYTIYGFRLIQGNTRRCGEDRREDFLYLESMPRRRDHVVVILRVKSIDQLIQADSSNMMLCPISERGGLLKGSNRLSPSAGYLYKLWDYQITEWYSPA